VLLRKVHDLRDFGFSNLVGIDAADAYALLMDMEHALHRLLMGLVKKPLKHVDDKFHRGVVVIEHDDPVHRRLLRLWLRPDNGSNIRVAVVGTVRLLIAHDSNGFPQLRMFAPRRGFHEEC